MITQAQKDTINKRFSENAIKVMNKRYLCEMKDGTKETPADLYHRVAKALAEKERAYKDDNIHVDEVYKNFFEIMSRKQFTPAGRTLTNAGAGTPIVANCIVLPIEDSMEDIFQTLKEAALLQQAGSGLGFDFSKLRPANAETKKSRGSASGPVSFLKVYDTCFGTIKQQGRHGANMAMMRVDHPDILDFITCKEVEGTIRNFNLTVVVTDEFMNALKENPNQPWFGKFNGKKMKLRKIKRFPNGSVEETTEVDITVKELFDQLVACAWLNGEPGIAFIDTVNKTNPLPGLGDIAASNPCGEQFLHAYDNCNLGSINLAELVKDKKIDWDLLKHVTRYATRLLDNVVDSFDFPVDKVTNFALKNRRIGLGILGFADMLYQLEVRYDSDEGVDIGEKVMGFINRVGHEMSIELAEEKGVFPNYDMSFYPEKKVKMRNAAITTVAPTGSISMALDASSGIEPNFAIAFIKQDKDGVQFNYLNHHFEKALNKLDISDEQKEEVIKKVIKTGSVQNIEFLDKAFKDIFVVAMDILGDDHMKMQAAFQKHVDNSISKTVNFTNEATKEDVAHTFIRSWEIGCKSLTVYRDGSRQIQVLNIGKSEDITATTDAPDQEKEEVISSKNYCEKDHNKVPRPDVLFGKTYKVKTGYGNLYVTINNDEDGNAFEVFATIGKSGGFFQEQSEAICRLISLSLRSHVRIDNIIDSIKGIRGPSPIFTANGTVSSLPDAIGITLETHINPANILKTTDLHENKTVKIKSTHKKSIADFGHAPGCPDCGAPLVMEEGCVSCKSCGFTKCS